MSDSFKKISFDKFEDYFVFYEALEHQHKAVEHLYDTLVKLPEPNPLATDSEWMRMFTPSSPPLDSNAEWFTDGHAITQNKEEASSTLSMHRLIGPKKGVKLKPGDTYLVMNDSTNVLYIYDNLGVIVNSIPALARGMFQDNVWNVQRSDTPPGLYKLGLQYVDYMSNWRQPEYSRTLMSYGWRTYDMVDLEGNEDNTGRAGICLHGGGSACGWPGAIAPKQPLYPTYGCIRVHNQDLEDIIAPLYQKGTVYVGVCQEL